MPEETAIPEIRRLLASLEWLEPQVRERLGGEALGRFATAEQRYDRGRILQASVTRKVRLTLNLHIGGLLGTEVTRGARTLTLGLHLAFEPLAVDVEFAFTRDVGCQIGWKTEGVIELEHHIARDDLALHLADGGIELGAHVVEAADAAAFADPAGGATFTQQLLAQDPDIDVVVEVTGTVGAAARVVLHAIDHGNAGGSIDAARRRALAASSSRPSRSAVLAIPIAPSARPIDSTAANASSA